MNHYHQPYTFLLVVKSVEDARKLDEAIHAKKLEFQKIGATAYLGFFFDMPDTLYPQWKSDFGIEDEIHWIRLADAHATK